MQQPLANGIFVDKRFNIQKQLADNLCNYCYLALDTTQEDRPVILSFPKTELLIIPGFNAAFKDAWEHLSRARLNGMVKIIGGGIYESHPYAILQHTNYPTLLQLVKQGDAQQSPEAILNWVTPLAVILDELHQADYVHSHLRPDSVQIGSQQQVIIGDFITEFALQRLGKFKDALTTLNASDYLAPEFIKSNYTGSYDQYLLATLIYWALSGKAPFASDLGEDYRMRVATTRVPSLPLTPDYSQSFVDVLDQALERNPTKRFADCREFVNRLQTALHAEPEPAAQVDVPPEPLKITTAEPAPVTKSPLIGMKAVAIESMPDKSTAAAAQSAAMIDDAIIAERAYQEPVEKAGKKHLLWWLVVLVGVAGTAYTMLNSHDADQITASGTRSSEPAAVEVRPASAGTAVVSPSASVSSETLTNVSAPNAAAVDIEATGSALTSGSDEGVEESANGAGDNMPDQTTASSTTAAITNSDAAEATETLALSTTNSIPQSEDPVTDPEQLPVESLGSSAVSEEGDTTQGSTESESVSATDPEGSESALNPTQVTQNPELVEGAESREVIAEQTDQAVDNEALQEPAVVDTRVNVVSPEGEEQLLASEIAAAQALINEVSVPAVVGGGNAVAQTSQNAPLEATNAAEPTVEPPPQPQARSRNTSQPLVASQTVVTTQPAANVPPQNSAQTERERIRAIKARELARIKAITDDCVIGGRIHREAAVGNLAYVKNCMSVGVNPDITQSNRWTVLHIAARNGHLNMAKLLVAQGAQINAKAADGSTPLDMAIASRHQSLERFLASRGGVRSN